MKRLRSLFRAEGRPEKRLSLLAFFVGRVTLSADGACAATILNLCMRYAILYGELAYTEDGKIRLSTSYAAASRLRALCRVHGIALTVERSRGFREVLRLLVCRPGLPIGIALAVTLAVLSSTHLWEIRVTGNDTLSRSEVVSELSLAGLSLGDRIRSIDVDSIENRLLMHSDRISWITVNLIGNVAEVQIREKTTAEEEADTAPANLVARCDGVIVSLEILHGNILTKVGTAVREGEVLVSGLYDSVTQGMRYTRAVGAIYAETEHTFEIEVPYRFERTEYTGVSGTRYELIFFGRRLSLYESEGYGGENTVERLSFLRVFGKDLPIGLSVATSYEASTVAGVYSAERAMEIAYYRLSRELASLPGMQGILEKTVSYEVGEDAYTLKCRIRCIENIAETKNIEINLFE